MLNEWGIENKVFFHHFGYASSNTSMQNFLKEHLGLLNSLLFERVFSYMMLSSYLEPCCSRWTQCS